MVKKVVVCVTLATVAALAWQGLTSVPAGPLKRPGRSSRGERAASGVCSPMLPTAGLAPRTTCPTTSHGTWSATRPIVPCSTRA